MKTSLRIVPLVVGLFCTFTLVSPAREAHAAKSAKDTVGKVVEINKQALAQIQAGKFDAARDGLWNAVSILGDAGLSEHEISARTHVHLAAVYLTGFKDKGKAVRQFVMALKINPEIKITPQIESPALVEAMETARGQLGGGSPAVAAAEPSAESASKSRPVRKLEDEEPSPPSKVREPLFCPLALEVPPSEDIMVRCVTQKKSRQASATLYYREAGSENFTTLPMIRSPKGWLSATVPGAAVTGNAFGFYIIAKVPGSKDANLGNADSPTLLPVVSGASPMNNALLATLLHHEAAGSGSVKEEDDSAPLREITDQYKADEDLRKYHRRYVGAVFVSLGGGMGMTSHGSMTAAGNFTDEGGQPIQALPVGAGSNLASLAQVLPEVGYVVSEKLAISLQGRLQYLPFDSTGQIGGQKPPTLALAGFLRGQYNFWTIANFQTFVSGAVGGGPHVFMGYVPKTCDSSNKSDTWFQQHPECMKGRNDHSNVILSGPVALAAGVGFLWHMTRNFGFWMEARGMSSVAPIMFLGEVNAGISVALKFEKSAAPAPKESEGGWEAPPEDKALFEAPPVD